MTETRDTVRDELVSVDDEAVSEAKTALVHAVELVDNPKARHLLRNYAMELALELQGRAVAENNARAQLADGHLLGYRIEHPGLPESPAQSCWCGWEGPPRTTIEEAEADGAKHLSEHGVTDMRDAA